MELDLVAELALVCRDADGRKHSGAQYAVAAGELAELSMLGRVAVDAGFATVVDPRPTQRPDLDPVLGWLLSYGKPMRLTRGISERAGFYDWRIRGLADAGLFEAEHTRALGMFPISHYRPHPEARDVPLTRLWHLLRGWREPDLRTTVLAGILWGSGLGRALIPYREDRSALRFFGRRDPLGLAVRELRDEQANAAAGIVAATVVVTTVAGGS